MGMDRVGMQKQQGRNAFLRGVIWVSMMVAMVVAGVGFVYSQSSSSVQAQGSTWNETRELARSDSSTESYRLSLAGYPNKTSCSGGGPPWQPQNSNTNHQQGAAFDGNRFKQHYSGCPNRWTTGGPGQWVSTSSYGNWTTAKSKPSQFSSSSTVTSGCDVHATQLSTPAGVSTIWSQCPKYSGSETSTNYTWNLWNPNPGPISSDPDWRILSSGSTLFRKVFTLTQAECDAIGSNGGRVTLNTAGDDWYRAYINGQQIDINQDTPRASGQVTYSASGLDCTGSRQNVLAIQVVDKAVWSKGTSSESNAAGLRYRLYFETNGWNLTPISTANKSSARAGETIQWQHRVRHSGGPYNGSATYQAQHSTTNASGPWNNVGTSWSTGSMSGGAQTPLQNSPLYTVTDQDVANGQVCRRTEVYPSSTSYSGSTWANSCVTINANWILRPNRPTASALAVQPGEQITFTHNVTNIAGWPHNLRNQPTNFWPEYSIDNGATWIRPETVIPSSAPPIICQWNPAMCAPTIHPAGWRFNSLDAGATTPSPLLPISGGVSPIATTSVFDTAANPGVTTVCYRTSVQYEAWNRMTEARSDRQCVDIGAANEFYLEPRMTNPGNNRIVEPGETLTPRGTITNTPASTGASEAVEWRLTRINYNPGFAPNGGGTGMADPCAYFTTVGRDAANPCRDDAPEGARGTEPAGIARNAVLTALGNATTIGDHPVGYKICYALSVRKHSHNAPNDEWRHSEPICLTIGKKPKVQVHGGDLLVGRSFPGASPLSTNSRIDTSRTTLSTGNIYGSWGEYGLFAPGSITGMASDTGALTSPADAGGWNKLTFGNTAPGQGVYPLGSRTMPNIEGLFSSRPSEVLTGGTHTPQSIAGVSGTDPGGRVARVAPGITNLTINGGELRRGQWGVLYAPGVHVVINGNLTYANDPLANAAEIPQLVIIAENITINSSVTVVDAWLVGKNAISTCDQQASGSGNAVWLSSTSNYTHADANLNADQCADRLTVNGPVVTSKLFMRRTAGSEPASTANPTAPGEPGEEFNLRPDAYMWLNHQSRSYAALRTGVTTELPPRY